MLGGYQIINLSNIDLTIGTSQVSITDKDVLAQLRELREHIEDNYNFAIPLNRKLKPVLLRLRDKKNGEKQEVSVWANLSIITNNKTFKIEALVDSVSMKAIQIEIVFQQLTDDDGNKYWDIKTAKYLYTENINIEGGTVQADVLMENIKDEDGHNRFIEGDISLQNTVPEGVTLTYGKWSLSGTHLMIVFSITIADETVLSTQYLGNFTLPKWISDKIFTWFGNQIRAAGFQARASDGSNQNMNLSLRKSNVENGFGLYLDTAITLTAQRILIASYDLLIDNESQD